MQVFTPGQDMLDPQTRSFYRAALRELVESEIPFLVGGAYAFARYTGIERHTKDFDVFVRPADCPRVLDLFARAGYRTELTFTHWLGKVYAADAFIDIIYSSGNGVADVDDLWFTHAVEAEVLGAVVKLCPAEEMIWQKAFIQERERFDGGDIAHLIRARAEALDWPHLLRRFGPHWRVLLAHLVLFGYVYPGERQRVPPEVMRELLRRLEHELASGPGPAQLCQGTLLSRAQYLIDVESWGYRDARLFPHGSMTEAQVEPWTAAIEVARPAQAEAPALTPAAPPAA